MASRDSRSAIPTNASSAEIDALVRDKLGAQSALYTLDMEMMERLHPDLIVTQALCHVCAVSVDEVQALGPLAQPVGRASADHVDPVVHPDREHLAQAERARSGRAAVERPDVSHPLASVLAKALRNDVEARWGSAGEFRSAIEEAVDRARPLLAEVHLVHIGVQELGLVVGELERHGHDGLLELAPERAPVIEEIVFDELLRQRARALADLAGRDVDDQAIDREVSLALGGILGDTGGGLIVEAAVVARVVADG